MKENLSIQEVANLLNRSTKSIRNYIKSGKVKAKKVNGKHGPEFLFNMNEVRKFAQDYLSLAIDSQSVKKSAKKTNKKVASSKKTEETGMTSGMNWGDFAEKIIEIEAEKRKIIEDYAEYKAQLAFKMGQMESRLKLLDTAKAERTKLKKKVQYLEKRREEERVKIINLKQAKEFYESRPWYTPWKKFNEETVKVSK